MNHNLKHCLFSICTFIIILCLISSFGVFLSYHNLSVANQNIACKKIASNSSIVLLSDLHDTRFGKDNERLIEKVKGCEPDVIFTVGDMVSNYCKDYSYLDTLYKGLAEVAPVYCSLGNHETSHPEIEKIKETLSKHATLLDNEYIETSINGNEIRIGGLMNYHPDNLELNEYIRDFADTDKFTLLLSHCPEYYFWGVDEVGVDLMLSGHTHGGQVILPFKGGLYAPEQGWWPYYDYGFFYEKNATLAITRGLGSSKQILPRFNNPPEVMCITLEPEV